MLGFLGGELELDAQRDEPLLCAVVQVPGDPPSFGVGRRQQTRSRRPDLEQHLLGSGGEPLALERDRGHGPRHIGERRLVSQDDVVLDRRQMVVAVEDPL